MEKRKQLLINNVGEEMVKMLMAYIDSIPANIRYMVDELMVTRESWEVEIDTATDKLQKQMNEIDEDMKWKGYLEGHVGMLKNEIDKAISYVLNEFNMFYPKFIEGRAVIEQHYLQKFKTGISQVRYYNIIDTINSLPEITVTCEERITEKMVGRIGMYGEFYPAEIGTTIMNIMTVTRIDWYSFPEFETEEYRLMMPSQLIEKLDMQKNEDMMSYVIEKLEKREYVDCYYLQKYTSRYSAIKVFH